MKKLIYLFILAIGFTSCSVESIDSTENLLVADASAKLKNGVQASISTEPITEYTFKSGNSGNDKARLSVSNSCDVITMVFTPLNDEDISVKFDIFKTLPSVNVNNGNGNETLPNSSIKLDETDLDENNSYSISFLDLGVNATDNVFIFARMGNEYAGSQILGDWEYFTYIITEEVCDEPCISGYMFGDTEFRDLDETAKNWGWGHEFDMEAGDNEKRYIQEENEVLGYIEITLNGDGSVTIIEGPGVTVTHRYVADARPANTAPGQFDKTGNLGDQNGDGKFWVMVKADVCN